MRQPRGAGQVGKTGRLQTESGLREQLGLLESGTGPLHGRSYLLQIKVDLVKRVR
jgi:hypothetical protein